MIKEFLKSRAYWVLLILLLVVAFILTSLFFGTKDMDVKIYTIKELNEVEKTLNKNIENIESYNLDGYEYNEEVIYYHLLNAETDHEITSLVDYRSINNILKYLNVNKLDEKVKEILTDRLVFLSKMLAN